MKRARASWTGFIPCTFLLIMLKMIPLGCVRVSRLEDKRCVSALVSKLANDSGCHADQLD
jgi:hypothetical protein